MFSGTRREPAAGRPNERAGEHCSNPDSEHAVRGAYLGCSDLGACGLCASGFGRVRIGQLRLLRQLSQVLTRLGGISAAQDGQREGSTAGGENDGDGGGALPSSAISSTATIATNSTRQPTETQGLAGARPMSLPRVVARPPFSAVAAPRRGA
jgi:hypothetical protein